ncbi:MAG: hypothetical protein ACI9SX_000843 [Pseudoalteromonas tetraodonis]
MKSITHQPRQRQLDGFDLGYNLSVVFVGTFRLKRFTIKLNLASPNYVVNSNRQT